MEVNVNNLTLGNFLYYPEKDMYVTVVGINKNSITVEWVKYNNGERIKYSETIKDLSKLKYIPFSPSIFIYLFKLNLREEIKSESEENKLYKSYTDFLNIFTFIETDYVNRPNDGENKVWLIHIDNYDHDTIGVGDFIYIHEIQNFFKSVGFDLEKHIKLTDKQEEIFYCEM